MLAGAPNNEELNSLSKFNTRHTPNVQPKTCDLHIGAQRGAGVVTRSEEDNVRIGANVRFVSDDCDLHIGAQRGRWAPMWRSQVLGCTLGICLVLNFGSLRERTKQLLHTNNNYYKPNNYYNNYYNSRSSNRSQGHELCSRSSNSILKVDSNSLHYSSQHLHHCQSRWHRILWMDSRIYEQKKTLKKMEHRRTHRRTAARIRRLPSRRSQPTRMATLALALPLVMQKKGRPSRRSQPTRMMTPVFALPLVMQKKGLFEAQRKDCHHFN